MFKRTMTALAVTAAMTFAAGTAFATCEHDCDEGGDTIAAKWKLVTNNVATAFGPQGTQVLVGNLENDNVHVKIGDVLDVQQQALGTTLWEGVLGEDGNPLQATTGLAAKLEGKFKLNVKGGELCLTDCTPPAE